MEHFKILDEIAHLAKMNSGLSSRLKKMVAAYKNQSQLFSLGEPQTEYEDGFSEENDESGCQTMWQEEKRTSL